MKITTKVVHHAGYCRVDSIGHPYCRQLQAWREVRANTDAGGCHCGAEARGYTKVTVSTPILVKVSGGMYMYVADVRASK